TAEPGWTELCDVLEDVLADNGANGGPIELERLKSRVYGLGVGADGRAHSFVLKRFDPWLARRNELVLRGWLAALGLEERAPGTPGAPPLAANLAAASARLERPAPPRVEPTPEQGALRGRLLTRLYRLRDDLPRRVHLLETLGGPDTLLHGDLWTTNTLLHPTPRGLMARLIDWDHAAVGPVSYDLSTFLYR